ncbi:MAG TPA: hypothetical protein HA341_00095 [Halobacteria archaeon]|jgi:hypothetical protein|nr:hypothetical protein [Halobacteria archaeon]
MNRTRIGDLIQIKEGLEATLSLANAIKTPDITVGSYIFTNSISRYMKIILDAVIKGHGAGFWIQAEYGAGKTHFLSTLASLLAYGDEKVWKNVQDDEIRNYRQSLTNYKLFPVLINLKGEGKPDPMNDDLFEVIEKKIEDSLEECGIRDKVKLTSDDKMVGWYRENPLRGDIDEYIRKNGLDPIRMDNDSLASYIRKYCDERRVKINIPTSIKETLKSVYDQLNGIGYNGMLFVIDEFAGWQRRHPDSKAYATDEEVLETIAWILPREMGLNIYTMVASAGEPPAKLRGDRFRSIYLFAEGSEREFDLIVSRRVRNIIDEKKYEIKEYYEYYRSNGLLKKISEEYFFQIFPFQPSCFDVMRRVLKSPMLENLASTRSAIYYIYNILGNSTILNRDTLIRVCDLLSSQDLLQDIQNSLPIEYRSYRDAIESIKSLDLKNYMDLSEDIATTLFMWYIANKDKPLSLGELTDMVLAPDTLIKNTDNVEYILSMLVDVPQIKYIKDKGAVFIPSRENSEVIKTFNRYKKKVSDAEIRDYWLRLLYIDGFSSLFMSIEGPDRPKKRKVFFKNIEYPGEVILSRTLRDEYLGEINGDSHFRIVFLSEPADIDPAKLADVRIAVCVPSDLPDTLKDRIREYCAISKTKDEYFRSDQRSDDDKEWIKNKEKETIINIIREQRSVYRDGKVFTNQMLPIDTKKVFTSTDLDQILSSIVGTLLSSSYTKQPFDTFKRKFSENEARKLFEGFFKANPKRNALDACRNYGPNLALSLDDDPEKFHPMNDNSIFQFLRAKLDEKPEGVPVWRIYKELEDPPYGLLKNLITLYILAFVRANTNTEIRLKSGSIGRINSFNIEKIDWNNFEKDLDILVKSTDVSWNDVVIYARKILPDLKNAYSVEEIKEQEKKLIERLKELLEEYEKIKEDIKRLSNAFREEITYTGLDRLKKLLETTNYREFYGLIEDLYSKDVSELGKDIREFTCFKEVADKSLALLSMKTYVEKMRIQQDDPLFKDRENLIEEMRLSSLIKDPSLADRLIDDFEGFKRRYAIRYKKTHEGYYRELDDLRKRLESIKGRIETINRFEKLGVSTPVKGYNDLITKIKPCKADVNVINVETEPICTCGFQIGMKAPVEDVNRFIENVENMLRVGINNLIQIIKPLEHLDDRRILNKIIEKKDYVLEVCELIDDGVVDYIKHLQNTANIIQIEGLVLERFSGRFIDEESVYSVVEEFKRMIESEMERAKRNNPGKKVRMVLR